MIQIKRITQWMNVIRNYTDIEQYRILESFWESQLSSKHWIVKVLNQKNISCHGSVYIFGGWFGTLGGILLDFYENISDVYSIDVDPYAKTIGEQLNPDVKFITEDMQTFVYKEQPSLIINTSTEHLLQSVYDAWYKNLPTNVPVVLQGNNYFSCDEHIRCSTDLEDFKKMNTLDSIEFEGELDCKQFTRYMTIGYKV